MFELRRGFRGLGEGRRFIDGRVFALLLLVAACSGCFAGVGPTIGFVDQGGVTKTSFGWEASGATVTVGQSYVLHPADGPHEPWRSRTYLAWEPRLGLVSADKSGGYEFGGLGGTIGMRWDQLVEPSRSVEFGAVGGVFAGGGYVVPRGNSDACSDRTQMYLSFALGFRGSEFYLAPKVGLTDVPRLCLDFGTF